MQPTMAVPAIPAIPNQSADNSRYASASLKWLTNEMPNAHHKQITDENAWAKVNGGKGPEQPRLTKDGRRMTELSCKLRNIQDKLVAQGVDPTIAWNFAGEHLKGNR
jgi:hypothetical protein